FKKLMEVITDFTILYLKEQIKSGVHVIQIFDTWAGILSPEDYGIFCKPYIQRIISVLKPYVPIIYFTSNSAGLLNHLKDLEWDVISLDWKVEIKDALKFLKNRVIQGNLDPFTILADLDIVFDKAKKVLIQAAEAKAHIFNFGHGVNVNTSVDKLKKLVDFVHNYRV
ncbi:MAG: uroporphyrinogen decarboxylase, partial [Thermodesulfovibrio sp.]|nr:uroporphyrinogen decarboxylase [Thermodesulfovibrio sp.]